ncbi:MAG: hypothetical protein AAB436_03530 [Patescibacteria group bacterium]
MRAINHALTGAVIGLVVGEPLIAVPVAFVSHFICDIIPHHDFDVEEVEKLRSGTFKKVLYGDTTLCVVLVVVLAVLQPENWQLAAICALVAAAPDFASFGKFRSANGHKPLESNAYTRFAGRIQWFERPIGGIVEVAWFVAAIFLLLPFLG